MSDKEKKRPDTSTAAPPQTDPETDDAVRRALNVQRPPGGWPWNNKPKSKTPKKR